MRFTCRLETGWKIQILRCGSVATGEASDEVSGGGSSEVRSDGGRGSKVGIGSGEGGGAGVEGLVSRRVRQAVVEESQIACGCGGILLASLKRSLDKY